MAAASSTAVLRAWYLDKMQKIRLDTSRRQVQNDVLPYLGGPREFKERGSVN